MITLSANKVFGRRSPSAYMMLHDRESLLARRFEQEQALSLTLSLTLIGESLPARHFEQEQANFLRKTVFYGKN